MGSGTVFFGFKSQKFDSYGEIQHKIKNVDLNVDLKNIVICWFLLIHI